jgi:hypothetical protein
MSDSEEITRKVRGGKKIVDKPAVAKRATKTTEVEPAEKKRKLANGDIKYVQLLLISFALYYLSTPCPMRLAVVLEHSFFTLRP